MKVNKKMKQLMKVFQEINKYPKSIINKIAPAETNETSNNVQLNLTFPGKQGVKIITKMNKYIRKARYDDNNKDEQTYQESKV